MLRRGLGLRLRLILSLRFTLFLVAVLISRLVRRGFGRRKIVPQDVCDFEVTEDYACAAYVVRVSVRGYEVINLLNSIALERVQNRLTVLLIARVNEHDFVFWRDD